MRIVLFLRSLLYGGTERQVVLLARELKQHGHQVRIVTLYGGNAFADELAESDLMHSNMGKRGRFDLLLPHLRLIRLVRSWSADVVYSFLPAQNFALAVLAPFLAPARIVFGVRAAALDVSRYDWLAKVSYQVEPWAARTADLVIANSFAGQEWCAARGFPEDRIRVALNGIDVDRFRFNEAARQHWRTKLGVAGSGILVAMIGRLDVMKDYPTFLRASAQLARVHADMVFACIGNGADAYRAELRALAEQLGISERLIMLPAQDKVEELLSAVDIGVLASAFGEGFPNILAEAMACGVPMVATDTGDCRRIVDGLLPVVPPSDPHALAAAVEQLISRLDDAAPVWRQALRTRVEQNFSSSVLGIKTEALLQRLCGK